MTARESQERNTLSEHIFQKLCCYLQYGDAFAVVISILLCDGCGEMSDDLKKSVELAETRRRTETSSWWRYSKQIQVMNGMQGTVCRHLVSCVHNREQPFALLNGGLLQTEMRSEAA